MKRMISCGWTMVAFWRRRRFALTSGCAVTQGRETAKAYAKDKEIAARIKAALYSDPDVKGTQVEVQALNGTVQLSGFVDSQTAKDRAGPDCFGHCGRGECAQ